MRGGNGERGREKEEEDGEEKEQDNGYKMIGREEVERRVGVLGERLNIE